MVSPTTVNIGGMYFNATACRRIKRNPRLNFNKFSPVAEVSESIRKQAKHFLAKINAGQLPAKTNLSMRPPVDQAGQAGSRQNVEAATWVLVLGVAAAIAGPEPKRTPDEMKQFMENKAFQEHLRQIEARTQYGADKGYHCM